MESLELTGPSGQPTQETNAKKNNSSVTISVKPEIHNPLVKSNLNLTKLNNKKNK